MMESVKSLVLCPEQIIRKERMQKTYKTASIEEIVMWFCKKVFEVGPL